MPAAIGEHRIFQAHGAGGGAEPWRQARNIDTVFVQTGAGRDCNRQGRGIEIGAPDDPRLRGPEVGTLGESATPRASFRQRLE